MSLVEARLKNPKKSENNQNYLEKRKKINSTIPSESVFDIKTNNDIYTITTNSQSKIIDILKNSTWNKLNWIVKKNFIKKIENKNFNFKNIQKINSEENKNFIITIEEQTSKTVEEERILEQEKTPETIKEEAIIDEIKSDLDEENRISKQEKEQINSESAELPKDYYTNKFEELYYNDFNFSVLSKILLKNLDTRWYFSDYNWNINYNWTHKFTEQNLKNIFLSKNISEKKKKQFSKNILSIIKKNILKWYLVDGYSKKDVKKQKKELEKEFFNNPIYIEQKLEKLWLNNLEKYFPEKNFKYWFFEKINNKIDRYKKKFKIIF